MIRRPGRFRRERNTNDTRRWKFRLASPASFRGGLKLERRLTWSPGGRGGRHAYLIGYLAKRGRTRYLIFRGTVAEKEWWKDFQVVQKPCPIDVDDAAPGQVHLGFLKIFDSLDPPPAALVREINGPLIIAGHSLGAALAILSALELRRPAADGVYFRFSTHRRSALRRDLRAAGTANISHRQFLGPGD